MVALCVRACVRARVRCACVRALRVRACVRHSCCVCFHMKWVSRVGGSLPLRQYVIIFVFFNRHGCVVVNHMCVSDPQDVLTLNPKP